jgi:hypothetical protein
MGTGNVDNQSGSVSVVPLYAADGNSGGDKNVPGSIGGVYNYVESRQLPPGSPGINSSPDGTAGSPDPSTFTLGNFVTEGFTEVEGIAATSFNGTYSFEVGPLISTRFLSPPPHQHFGISAGYLEGLTADKNGCGGAGTISPNFYEVQEDSGEILRGPEGVPEGDRARGHIHGLSNTAVFAGNNADSNHANGTKGDTTAKDKWTQTLNMHQDLTSSNPSFSLFLEPAPATLSNTSKSIFNASLKFTLRNNKPLPLLAAYFRLKYMIKAY